MIPGGPGWCTSQSGLYLGDSEGSTVEWMVSGGEGWTAEGETGSFCGPACHLCFFGYTGDSCISACCCEISDSCTPLRVCRDPWVGGGELRPQKLFEHRKRFIETIRVGWLGLVLTPLFKDLKVCSSVESKVNLPFSI